MSLSLFIVKKDPQQKKEKDNESYSKDDGNTHYLEICLTYAPAAKIEGTQMPT